MDGVCKNTESICNRYVQSIMALTYIDTKKYHKISEEYHTRMVQLKQSCPYVSVCKVS